MDLKTTDKAAQSICQLPYSTFKDIADVLEESGQTTKLAKFTACGASESCSKFPLSSKAEHILYELSDQKKSISDLLILLDKVKLECPQLVLRRKYIPVKIVAESKPVSNVSCGSKCELTCRAVAFPYPKYKWYRNDVVIPGADGPTLNFEADCHLLSAVYHCVVTNCVDDDPRWFKFYASKSQTKSKAEGKPFLVEITCDKGGNHVENCDGCASAEQMLMMKVKQNCTNDSTAQNKAASLMDSSLSSSVEFFPRQRTPKGSFGRKNDQSTINSPLNSSVETLTAVDKVALIISNSEYTYLPKLTTPACDGQSLAACLLNCDFKTVTLADLKLEEMKLVVQEYCRLLGAGVYALFYFVGHGFEVGGQCYLLPVDAPAENYTCKQCLCAEEVLTLMQETNPALNVILLDVCRRLPSSDSAEFAQHKIFKPKVNRNTVFGYATSFGEGAYEICGETNGIFMKHFKKYVEKKRPITEVLNLTMRDLENDPKANDAQFPEIKTNLTRPRSLRDEMDFAGHTKTFDHRTFEWQNVHELPDPLKVHFECLNLLIMIWFDFCGHFVNMIYIFTTVYSGVSQSRKKLDTLQCSSASHKYDLRSLPRQINWTTEQIGLEDDLNQLEFEDEQENVSTEIMQDDEATKYLAYLKFSPEVNTNEPILCEDSEQDSLISIRLLIRNLQRYQDLKCRLHLVNRETKEIIHDKEIVDLPKMLIAKLDAWTSGEATADKD